MNGRSALGLEPRQIQQVLIHTAPSISQIDIATLLVKIGIGIKPVMLTWP